MTTTTGKQSLPASHGRNRVRRQPKDVAYLLKQRWEALPVGYKD